MEDELYRSLYRRVFDLAARLPATPRVQHRDRHMVLSYFWAVLHDRPVCWACQREHWPAAVNRRWSPPSNATMSRRLRTASVAGLIHRLERLVSRADAAWMGLCKFMDSKPLVIGRAGSDRDATLGYDAGGKAKGYKLHQIIDAKQRVLVWAVAPMNRHDAAVARELLPQLRGVGYVVADNAYDASPLYDLAHAGGHQLVAPPQRTHRRKGYGRRAKSPHRRRSLDILAGGFGRQLLRDRGQIERAFGQMVAGPCGLTCLPPWVRGLRRVTRWVQAKLIIQALRRQRTAA